MIYADNAATTRLSDKAYEKMLPFLREQYGNASSQYSLGIKAKRAVEQSRQQIARAINAASGEIIFTSSGSEANSWVLHNISELYRNESAHIITTSIEHPSILKACRVIERKGIEVTYLPVDRKGRVFVDDIKAAIKPNTKLVSVMFANNEIGTVQPISEIGEFLKKYDIRFHTDAVQAVGHIPVDVNVLNVDFLTASAHKFNGSKGTGILYKRFGVEIDPLLFGGEQENELRAGTENVAGIVAAGCALKESIALMDENTRKLNEMADKSIEGIYIRIPSMQVNGDTNKRLPGLLNLSFGDVSGESLMHLLDLMGICISTSSACTAGSDEASHVLLALGLSEKQAKSSIRISYGKYNTFDEIDIIIKTICDAYYKIKAIQ